jgi:hypothetical protein
LQSARVKKNRKEIFYQDIPSTHVACVNGTAELRANTEAKSNGPVELLRDSLIDPKKVLLPPLHINLGLMKQFVKALPKEGECFKYLCKKFPGLSDAKFKEGIFVGPDIRKLLSDDLFETTMKTVEREAWNAFK